MKLISVITCVITCPSCSYKSTEIMPVNYCQIWYKCKKCEIVIKPKKDECCIYCSYGNVMCPSKQKKEIHIEHNDT